MHHQPSQRLEQVAIAMAISLQRLDTWWGATAWAATRTSRFTAVAPD